MRQGQEETYYNAIIQMMSREFKLRRPEWKIAVAQNGYLQELEKVIVSKLGVKTRFPNGAIPPLKVDIIFGIKQSENAQVADLLLFEVKRDALQLVDYSQLFGYLFAGKYISTGVLFRVVRDSDTGREAIISSPEFDTILKQNKLPLRFIINDDTINKELNFQIGIAHSCASEAVCQKPNWIQTQDNKGLCSTDELINRIESQR